MFACAHQIGFFALGGIKNNLISKRQKSVLKSKNKLQEHKKKRVVYERKKEITLTYSYLLKVVLDTIL